MIPTQHATGNTTPTTPTPTPAAAAPASVPIGAGVRVADLYAATAAEPYYTHPASDGRLVDAFYLLPSSAEAADGDYLAAAELSIRHYKDAKCYRATLSATSIRLQGGMFGQRFSLFAARTTTQVASIPAARFNAAGFAQFVTDVHALVAAHRTAEGDQS